MKTLKIFLPTIIIMVALLNTTVKGQKNTLAEIKIKTSAVCDMCKENIETALAFEKGVKKSTLDVSSKIVTVSYDSTKTTPEKIRFAIAKAGYDADEVRAYAKAYKKLDDCCKKGSVCNEEK